MKIEEPISLVVHTLGVGVKTLAQLRPVLQTRQESHFEKVVGMGLTFELKC